MNVSSMDILDILVNAKIEEPKAKAIVKAIEIVEDQKEQSLREYMEKNLMNKRDGLELENRLIKWFFGMLISQSIIVLGGVYFMVTYASKVAR
ncbi:MAG: hypothetical protein ACOY3I_04990 [Verrucomicrobiota bacterium]